MRKKLFSSRRGASGVCFRAACVLFCLAAGAVGSSADDTMALLDRSTAVVTTTMLGAAVTDLAGNWLEPVALIPAEGCPGHFDISPRDLGSLERAVIVLRHDYQGWLEDALHTAESSGQRFGVLSTSGPQTLPEHYLTLCVQLAALLSQTFPEHALDIRLRLEDIEARLKVLGEREQKRARAKLQDMPVVAAGFQSEFATWAGARVVATFYRAEEMSLDRMTTLLDTARKERVRGVVGNLQWGDREMRSLSESLKVPGAVLSNFPASVEPEAFDRLLVSNVSQLLSLAGDE